MMKRLRKRIFGKKLVKMKISFSKEKILKKI